jgi:hypothetical protein
MRTLLGVAVLVAFVAALDAALGGHWDQFALLCVLGVLVLIVMLNTGRRVRPRPDLMNWVEQQAATTDDDPNRVVDRALAAYRAQMLPDAEDGRGGR